MTNHNTSPARLTPPVGGFQEIDGRRVFVHRSGSGGPAVVFLPGASAIGLDYFGVQQAVAQFTTTVVYDRGGTGYSDPLPLPRTATAVATELRELLRARDIPAPYVLVPHSLGGFYADRFAQLYPRDVAGLVRLDAFHRDWDDFMPPTAALAAVERMGPDRAQLEQMRPALHEMYAESLANLPGSARQALIAVKSGEGQIRAGIAERTGLSGLAAELRAGPAVPDVPVIALTVVDASPDRLTPAPEREMQDARKRLDAALVSAVPDGEQRLISDTAHHRLCFDRPDAVVQAVRDVVDRAARTRMVPFRAPRSAE